MKLPTKNKAERKVNERRKRNLNAEAGSHEAMTEYREHWKNESARIEKTWLGRAAKLNETYKKLYQKVAAKR